MASTDYLKEAIAKAKAKVATGAPETTSSSSDNTFEEIERKPQRTISGSAKSGE